MLLAADYSACLGYGEDEFASRVRLYDTLKVMEADFSDFHFQTLGDVPILVIGVNGDVGNPKRILLMNENRDISFRSFRNDSNREPFGSIAKRWNVRSLPTTYLIGTDGEIVGKWIGNKES